MRQPDFVLAIDMGSSWCKAAYVDETGRLVAQGRVYTRGGPQLGHNAADLARSWSALAGAVRKANAELRQLGHTPAPLAVGISCRKAPGIWLDEAGQPVGVARAEIERAGREDIDASYAADVWGESDPFAYGYGVDLIGNTRWLKRQLPETWQRVRRAGTLHTWLMRQLTGRWVTSPAAGPGQFAWPQAVVELTGLPVEAFPTVVESFGVVTTLAAGAATELELAPETPVVTGTHDGAASNLGSAAIDRGEACLTLGTNGVLRVVTGERLPRQFGYPVVEEHWAMVRDIVAIAPHLDRVVAAVDGLGKPVLPDRHIALTAEAEPVPAGSHGLSLPVGASESLVSIAEQHPPGVVYRAALEGIGLAFRGVVDVAKAAGASPERFVATGGATANQLLLTIMSAMLGQPIEIAANEAGLRGAAILAATGAGMFPAVDRAVAAMVPAGQPVVASAETMAIYSKIVASIDLPAGVAPGDKVRGRYNESI